MAFVKFNDEVFYTDDKIVTVRAGDIGVLKRLARDTPRKRSRLCTHRHVDDAVHEMLIVHEKDTYVRPHKHLGKTESFHVIQGEMDVIVFDDEGTITDVIEMGEYHSDKVFYYRLDGPRFHTVLVKSEVIVFHETTSGPFRREETLFAEWSPADSDADAVCRFVEDLKARARLMSGGRT